MLARGEEVAQTPPGVQRSTIPKNGEKALPIQTAGIHCCVHALILSAQELEGGGGHKGRSPPETCNNTPNTDIFFTVAGLPSSARALC
jgi:hypothetical protein